MCAGSDAKIRDKDVDFYMGYYGGYMNIGCEELEYRQDGTGASREEFIDYLCKFKKEELATLFADLIDNSEE